LNEVWCCTKFDSHKIFAQQQSCIQHCWIMLDPFDDRGLKDQAIHLSNSSKARIISFVL